MTARKKTPSTPAADDQAQATTTPEAPAQPVTSEPVQPPPTPDPPTSVSTPGYKAETPILHSGEKYLPGDEVLDLTPDEAARLLAQGFISLIIDGDAS